MIVTNSLPNGTAPLNSAPEPLTEAQRQFAAEHHNLIYSFLYEKGWDVDEYYDIAAFGFLRSVIRYCNIPSLSRYAFSTIAWRAMGQSIASYRRAEARRQASEKRYLSTAPPNPPGPFEDMAARLLLQDLAIMSTPDQYDLAVMRLQGYSIAEVARAQGMSPKRVRKLLTELYRVYLKLYNE